MLRTYRYHLSCHIMLHQHIIEFFNRIEFETGDFDEAFFGTGFLDIVNRHPTILKKRSIYIYNVLRRLKQSTRSAICEQIRESNDIERICSRECTPVKLDRNVKGFRGELRKFFIDLYQQVLDGPGFRDKYATNLRTHFNHFNNLNKDITKCPFCGIGELKKAQDEIRDQYDHYLPKTIYPFSSVNFENLVPACMECNSITVKGDSDPLVSGRRIFFPFDSNHQGILIECSIKEDAMELNDIEWNLTFITAEDQEQEIESWKGLYKIDSRYRGFIGGRIEKWYKHYWNTILSNAFSTVPSGDHDKIYFEFLENDESLGLSFIRTPALKAFLGESSLAQATLEASYYS